jgi:hypothetical protein
MIRMGRKIRSTVACVVLLVPTALSAVACESTTDTKTVDSSVTVDCSTDSRAQTYSSGMAAMGHQKNFQIQLTNSVPAPPARGNDSWSFKVLDANGQMVSDATVNVTPYMPDHKHGTQVVPTITQEPDGSFTLSPLYFFMPGLWTITFDITSGTSTDSAVFGFCVEG